MEALSHDLPVPDAETGLPDEPIDMWDDGLPHPGPLSPEAWAEWEAMCNAPPREMPELREFLARPSIFIDE